MQIKDIPGAHVARNYVLAQGTAGNADSWPIFRAPGDIEITAVRWIPAAAVSGAATNNFALAVQNKGDDGQGSTAVTQTKTYASGTDSVAHAAEALDLSATAANLLAAEGDVIALVRTVNASGLASPDGAVEVEYRFR